MALTHITVARVAVREMPAQIGVKNAKTIYALADHPAVAR